MIFSSKAEQISPSITLAIDAKAKKMKADGLDVIGFGAGEPDFNTPENIQDAAITAIKKGYTKYTAASGIKELKDAIADKFKNDNGLSYEPSQIIISTGAKQCLANAFQAILNPGDEVIIPVPYWVSYPELVKLADGVPVFVDTTEENNFKYTIEELNRAITDKSKAIIINSPNNPTGTVYTKDELTLIAEFAKKNDLVIISDEIYEKLIYDGESHFSIASLSEDAYNRTIVINGMSKSYAMTGWRIGYAACGNEKLVKLMSNIQSHVTSNPNSIAQYASVEALKGNQDAIASMISEFKKRRDYMVERILKMQHVSCLKPNGAFYVMINISKLLNKVYEGESIKTSLRFSELLLDKEKVAVIPGSAFGVDNYIRLSYATSMKNIEEGLNRIENFLNSL
ncbi:pyridoxal phosphate-dependent aminotransferase [Clostridium swellfunianum]|uniref:pyridoxal phosphate-dependent aminotransferase n=1 Tax=Clostridium swellfunianum TaxID=1367462 RepID=UPI00202E711B|nr:pyridoxal phosphate-dependent aminotransferase [Clostridium swellfunianum]MCM0648565.1 pyridoxal phosphate-dependent aminotransferase [Clostridium swellfunianum]